MSKKNLTIMQVMGSDDTEHDIIAVPLSGDMPTDYEVPETMPVMALPNSVLYPGTILPVMVGRDSTKALVKAMMRAKQEFVAVAQRDSEVEEPSVGDLYGVGTTARIVKVLTLPDGSQSVILHGFQRVSLGAEVSHDPYLVAKVSELPHEEVGDEDSPEFKALISSLKDTTIEMFRLSDSRPNEAIMALKNIDNSGFLVGFVAANVDLGLEEKQAILEQNDIAKRAQRLLVSVQHELQFLQLKNDIQSKAKQDIDRQQREYMLHQQMRTIQDELGDNGIDDQVDKYREQAKGKEWPEKVGEIFEKELDRLSRLNSNSSEFSLQQNYIETMLALPWGHCSKDNMDLRRAAKRLDLDHYGMDEVKERILEHLAVLKLKGDLKSPIICLYGPPGVGKTSLGRSIAEALGRKFVRMSLGGLHDETEIRGHRRTYVGAMLGRVLNELKNAGTSNPVFVLDEIDKISRDAHGDPSSAMLEVLDPEQNSAFHDNFLDIDYDLSKVMFIATANNLSTIPAPLLDRMELIPVNGYLLEEKVEIAERHLLPKEQGLHGIEKGRFSISRKVMTYIIENYTRESGVRELDKLMAKVCRKMALKVAREEETPKSLSQAAVREMFGVEKYSHDIWSADLAPGVVTGLAWTAVGGEILFIECSTSQGRGKLNLTGNLGDVMKESAVLALEYVRSNSGLWGLEEVSFDDENFHIHVPEGAVPKDGPSAGITMVTSIVSAMTGRKVRKRVAMTGEITLRGKVLPVGGITEKMLAAKRAGITDIILSEENRKDIGEIKPQYAEGLTFHYVQSIPEVVDLALEENPSVKPDLALVKRKEADADK